MSHNFLLNEYYPINLFILCYALVLNTEQHW